MDNNGMYNYSQPMYEPPRPVTPGKNITSLVLGIHSLYFAVCAISFCWIPIYGFIFGAFSIGCAIAVLILAKKIVETTGELTKKPEIGKKLSIAGIIVSIVAIVVSIIVIVVIIVMFGVGAMGSFMEYMNCITI